MFKKKKIETKMETPIAAPEKFLPVSVDEIVNALVIIKRATKNKQILNERDDIVPIGYYNYYHSIGLSYGSMTFTDDFEKLKFKSEEDLIKEQKAKLTFECERLKHEIEANTQKLKEAASDLGKLEGNN